jgi:serine/threonine-protein kinase
MRLRPGGEPVTGALVDGRYRLGPVLAHGGMSTVYRATDTRLDRPVAVKIMDPRLAADPAFRTRFEREARSAARIDHPAVVDVHDQGTAALDDEAVAFLVMELVEGGTLRDVLADRGPLDVPTALAVLVPVLAGLAEAHRLGLVHRDVKPENVLVSRTGEVKVGDFGLVVAAARAGASHAGMLLGTVAYLSPEQVATGSADARSDVYAVGVLAFELLTGTVPFTGDTAISVAFRHVHEDVPAPSTRVPVPAELDDLVVRATRRDPEARPADAAAFLAALCRVAEQVGIPRVPPPVPPAHRTDGTVPVPAEGGSGAVRGVAGTGPGPGRHGTRLLEAGAPASAGHVVVDRTRDRHRGRRSFGAAVAAVVALGALVGASGWWLGDDRWATTPRVVGLERAAAERLVAEADLGVTVDVVRHDTVAAGLVVAAEPTSDVRLPRGSTVALTVSSGRPVVPAVDPGTPLAAAEQAVRDAGLTPRVARREYSDTVPAGTVARTDPTAGTPLPSGAEVALVASRGPEPVRQVRVPFLVGRTVEDAEEELDDAGLEAQVENGLPIGGRSDDEAVVVQQSHGAGSQVDRGTVVTLRAF